MVKFSLLPYKIQASMMVQREEKKRNLAVKEYGQNDLVDFNLF